MNSADPVSPSNRKSLYPEVNFRMAEEKDYEVLQEMVSRLLGENYPPDFFRTIRNYWSEGCWVAECEEGVKGFIMGCWTSATSTRVLLLGVEDGYRNRGVGGKLLRIFEEKSREKDACFMELEVRKSNYTAFEFYLKRGFVVHDLLTLYYSNGENGIRMLKSLC